MKTKIIYSILSLVLSTAAFAQDRTTVTAKNYDVSDNLDLKAVASIFGESRDLPDFEQRLNDPSLQISNLDLNGDNEVDYIRVVESTEGNTRLVILQDVLAKDTYQDIATIEVERSGSNVQVQVVGDTYMYGPNYIYEPVYVTRPVFFDVWWGIGYRPYVSSWYWGYYPSYWHVWRPMPIRSYRSHIHVHINNYNTYNYVNVRRYNTAATLYNTRRNDGYARRYPDRSFAQRHQNVANRYELDRTRSATRANNAGAGTRNNTNGTRNNTSPTRNNATGTRDYPTRSNPRGGGGNPTIRTQNGSNGAVRDNNAAGANANPRTATPRNQAQIRENNAIQGTRNEAAPRATAPVRTEQSPRQVTPQVQPRQSAPQVQPRQSAPQMQQPRQAAPQQMQQPRQSAPQMQQPRQAAPQMQQSAPRAQQPSGGGATRGGNGGGRR